MESTRLQRVLRAIRFIEDHLKTPITVADVAEAVCYSPYHFCRTFNSLAHHSPYDYLMRRRLSQAARRLVESREKIIDIAFDYQFNSPESFSRAFKKMFTLQPKQFRSRGSLDRRTILDALTAQHLDLMNRAVSLIPERVHLDRFTLIGLMSPIRENTAAAARLWEDLVANLDTKTEDDASFTGVPPYIGVASFPQGWKQSGIYYCAGVRRQEDATPDPALITKQLPAGDYARFNFKARLSELKLILEYVFQTWLPTSGHSSEAPFAVISYRRKPRPEDDVESEQQVFVPLV